MRGIIDLTLRQPSPLPSSAEVSNNTKRSSHEKSSSTCRTSERPAQPVDADRALGELDQQRQNAKEVEADRNFLLDKTACLKRDLRTKDEETEVRGKNGDLVNQLQASGRKGLLRGGRVKQISLKGPKSTNNLPRTLNSSSQTETTCTLPDH